MLSPSLQIAGNIGIYTERLSVTIGFIALVFGLAVFTTCRSFTALLTRLGFNDPLQVRWYQTFHKYHAYYWPILWVTFVLHVMTALMHTELPAFSDPDASLHLYTLGSGILSFVFLIVLGFSCRTFAGIFHLFTGKSLTEGRVNGAFYRHHSIYWMAFLLATAVHLIFSYLHVGFWPAY